MIYFVSILMGLNYSGLAGLFASLRSCVTSSISLSLLVAELPIAASANWKFPEFVLIYFVTLAIGFFGTWSAVENSRNENTISERVKFSDFIVWHGAKKAVIDDPKSDED